MSLRKRGSVWWIDIVTPSGERVRRSTETGNKAQAQELHDKLKSEVWRLQKLGCRPRRLWQDAAVRWLREQAHKASLEDDKEKLRWLDRYLANRELESINRALIDAITEAKQAEGCSNGTVNRVLALIRAILRKCARDWEWLDRAPAVRLLKEPTRRIRFLSHHQARTLLARAAAASARHGDLHAGDRTSCSERDGTSLGAGRPVTQAGMDSSGPGEGQEGHRRTAQRHGNAGGTGAERQTSGSGVYLRRPAHQAGQHGSLVQSAQARGYRGLSLARSAPHLGELACAGRNAALRVTGARRMGDREDGAALRAPGRGTSGDICRPHGKSRHKYGTTTGFPRHSPIASCLENKKFVVARGGIEPPTRGFSVRDRNPTKHLSEKGLWEPNRGIFCALTHR